MTSNEPALAAPALLRRMAAWVYESFLVIAVATFTGFVFVSLKLWLGLSDNYRPVLQVLLLVALGAYFTWFWSHGKGQTLAMKTWHIGLVDKRGQRVGVARGLWRYVLCWLCWFVFPVLCSMVLERIFHPSLKLSFGTIVVWVVLWAMLSRLQKQRQFWHDIWAGTRLIVDGPTKPTPNHA